MNFKKSTLLTVIYGASLLLPAMSTAATDPATFQADKDRYIVTILERIQIDQKNLSCVQAAQDHAALKACGELVTQDHDVLEPKVEAPMADKASQKSPNNKARKESKEK